MDGSTFFVSSVYVVHAEFVPFRGIWQFLKQNEIRVLAGGWHGVTLGVTLPTPCAHPNLAFFCRNANSANTTRACPTQAKLAGKISLRNTPKII